MEGKVFYIYNNIYKIKQLLPSLCLCGLKHQDTGVEIAHPAFRHLILWIRWTRFLVVERIPRHGPEPLW